MIFEGSGVDSLREYSHEGEYQRTLYPFSKEALKKVSGITKSVFPQSGQELPTKHGPKHRSTFFTFSEGEAHDKYGTAGNALAAHGADIAVVSQGIARIALDGGSHKSGLIGPVCYMESRNKDSTGAPSKIAPLSAAFSQDGKWLYTTGYALSTGGMGDKHWANVVLRSEYGSSNPATVFLGGTAEGTGEGQFRVPLSVAVDTKGRLLVADYMNDRIQVFDENGKFIKSISSNKPVHIGVHPKTGQIFVCSWMIVNRFIKSDKFTIPAKFSRITSVDNPKMEFECDLPLNDYNGTTSWNRTGGLHYKVGFDFWSKEPQIWVLPGLPYTFGGWGVIQDKVDLKGTGIIILAEKDKKLEIVKDFATLTNENVNRVKPPVLVRQRLYVHPRTGDLYVAEGDSGVNKSFKQLVRVSPDKMANNKNDYQLVELPLTAEEMAIGHDGFFYLKTEYNIVRYDPSTWKEVPFDYGTEKRKVGFDDTKMASAVSSITLPATGKHGGWWHSGGFAVSVKGDIAASCYNTATKKGLVQGDENYYSKKDAGGAEQTYTPLLYPGRKTDF